MVVRRNGPIPSIFPSAHRSRKTSSSRERIAAHSLFRLQFRLAHSIPKYGAVAVAAIFSRFLGAAMVRKERSEGCSIAFANEGA